MGDVRRECNGIVDFSARQFGAFQRIVTDSDLVVDIRASSIVFGFVESSSVLGECEFGAVGGEQCVSLSSLSLSASAMVSQSDGRTVACASTAQVQAQAQAQALHTYRNAACELLRDD
jgi:hypothetical protein